MEIRTRAVIAVFVLAIAASACGQEGGGPTMPTPSSSSPSSPPPSGSSPPPTFSPPPTPTTKPPSGGATFRGQIEEGVEAGCLMLNVSGKIYQLIGGDRTLLRPGRRVAVAGDVQPDLATTCQQGIPLVVREVRPA